MATWLLDTFYSKKRANSKKWTLEKSVWCKSNLGADIHGSGGENVRNARYMDIRTVIYDVPDNMTMDDVRAFWLRVVVFTPFGVPVYLHSYNDIMNGFNPTKTISYALLPEDPINVSVCA